MNTRIKLERAMGICSSKNDYYKGNLIVFNNNIGKYGDVWFVCVCMCVQIDQHHKSLSL